jgi:hypothetical protein
VTNTGHGSGGGLHRGGNLRGGRRSMGQMELDRGLQAREIEPSRPA